MVCGGWVLRGWAGWAGQVGVVAEVLAVRVAVAQALARGVQMFAPVPHAVARLR